MITWKQPAYPGDAVRTASLARDGRIGNIRIQVYPGADRPAMVAAYLSGRTAEVPGNLAPIPMPDSHVWCHAETADAYFDFYVNAAEADGWTVQP